MARSNVAKECLEMKDSSKAPEAKVQEEKDKLAKYQQMLEQVKEQIARIS